MTSGVGTVKAILSGDTVIIVGKTANGPPPEITITLASLQAPKIARGPMQTDEVHAWESREFLRKLCIGKAVSFKIIQNVPAINRIFGDVLLENEQLSKHVVRSGWAAVKESREGSNSDVYPELLELESIAKAAKIGIYSTDPSSKLIRNICWSPAASEVEDLYNRNKGGIIRVVIEFVRDGASLRVLYLTTMTYISASLTGVVCPRLNTPKADADPNTPPTPPEPFALQAKHFSELRLLHREVDLRLDGIDRNGSLLVTVLHPKGNIAVEIIRAGLGKVADYSLVLLPKDVALSLRHAENEAKANLRCFWQNYTPAPETRKFYGLVVEVISADTIVVVEVPADKGGMAAFLTGGNLPEETLLALSVITDEMRLSLSSIRVPRKGVTKNGQTLSPDEPGAKEGKELVRHKLIGQVVEVEVEYKRSFARSDDSPSTPTSTSTTPTPGGGGDIVSRIFVSIRYMSTPSTGSTTSKPKSLGSTLTTGTTTTNREVVNISELLVKEGWATVIRHRAGEERSSDYDILLRSEQEAIANKKGLHNTISPPSSTSNTRVQDVSTDGKRAKLMFPGLQRLKSHKALVEYVFTGSRFKIFLPQENMSLQLSLSQVRAPALAKLSPSTTTTTSAAATVSAVNTGKPADPLAEESKRFARFMLLQRQVEVEFEDMDKNGIALGKLYLLTPTPTATTSTGGGAAAAGAGTRRPGAAAGVATSTTRSLPFSICLLRNGLAQVDKYLLNSSGGNSSQELAELVVEQTNAKANLKGLWQFYKEEVLTDVTDETGAGESGAGGGGGAVGELMSVKISEIINGCQFYLQKTDRTHTTGSDSEGGDGGGGRTEGGLVGVDELMNVFTESSPPPALLASSLRKGLQCAALFHEPSSSTSSQGGCSSSSTGSGSTGKWFRVRVEGVVKKEGGAEDIKASVFYLDYGNRETVPLSRLGELDPAAFTVPPQALECQLAFLRSPDVTTEFGRDAALAFSDKVWGQDLIAQVLWQDGKTGSSSSRLSYVILFDPSCPISINEQMTKEGFARVSESIVRRGQRAMEFRKAEPVGTALLTKLREVEEEAHRAYRNMWAYGDPGNSDDESASSASSRRT